MRLNGLIRKAFGGECAFLIWFIKTFMEVDLQKEKIPNYEFDYTSIRKPLWNGIRIRFVK